MDKQKKILIIEDDPDLGVMIKSLLQTRGYNSFLTKNGSQGIEKAFELQPDIILCDIQMKPIDGYQVYNILSESSLTNKIPFIFITGKSELDDIRFGLELGADDYLVKPFSNEDLLKSIKTRIAKHERLINIGKTELTTLMELSPNAVFISDDNSILSTNAAFATLFELQDSPKNVLTLQNILTKQSYLDLENILKKCFNSIMDCFNGEVTIQTQTGYEKKINLSMSSTQKHSGSQQVIGVFTPINNTSQSINNLVNVDLIYKALKDEEIVMTENLVTKLNNIFNQQLSGLQKGDHISFSKREQEVLKLSCDGLPIKLIADQLCISNRTVEKYRANLMSKTDSKNIVEVLIYALKNNLVQV